MQRLILLNGPPSSGKSTLAKRWVLDHPLALNLDIDVVWGLLGGWADAVEESGVAACNLAIAMATTHLAGGHDVIVPQFLAREQFILELEAAARAAGARFIELALIVDRAETLRAFAARSAAPETEVHVTARELLERSGGIERLSAMHDSYMKMLDTRPHAHRVGVVRDDIEATMARIESLVLALSCIVSDDASFMTDQTVLIDGGEGHL